MGQSNSPSENYLFLNVMVNFVIVNQKLTGSALHIEKNQTICDLKYLFIISVHLQAYGDNTCILIYLNWSLEAVTKRVAIMQCLGL